MPRYAIGLDYGTHSVRAVIANTATGKEIATATWTYEHGTEGIMLSGDTRLARQHPADYIKGAEVTIKRALGAAKRSNKTFKPDHVVGLGVCATGSTPLPLDRTGHPLAMHAPFGEDLSAMARLWKDHTAIAEAEEITDLARKMRPQYLSKCGGIYSSEWFWSKILHCLRHDPKTFDAAYTWAELSDWVPAILTGSATPETLRVNICAAGHKGLFNDSWGGYPDEKFLLRLDAKLADLRQRLPRTAQTIDQPVGKLTEDWAKRTGLPEGLPVATGALDGHLGAVGSGIRPGRMVKILGTSGADMIVVPSHRHLPDIPGLCGIVPGGIVPGLIGLEAGQAAIGDIFQWFAQLAPPAGAKNDPQDDLIKQAAKIPVGASGLLGLDWHNGNRTVLVDPCLSGMMVGQTLWTTPAELYRAWIEATAFGAATIINRLEQYNIPIEELVACGGVAEHNPLLLQIYADVLNRPIQVARSSQASALGAAIAAATVAGEYESIAQAQQAMTSVRKKTYQPDPTAARVYHRLGRLYKQLHDAFGTTSWKGSCHNVMKDLLAIRDEVRSPAS